MALSNVPKFINVPRISIAQRPEYRGWLESLLQTPHNRKVFLASGKPLIDKCFLDQAAQQLRRDHNKMKIARRAVESSASKKAYDDIKARFKTMAPPQDDAVSEAIAELDIPKVGVCHRTTPDYDGCDDQTYEGFARQMQWSNASVELTREMVDAAFRYAASELEVKGVSNNAKFRSMVDRCLRFESKKYWHKLKKERGNS